MPCEDRLHPLPHGGTSGPERALPAAAAAYARPDERTIAHRIVAAGRLARHISFTGLDGASAGDWRSFFADGETALIALLAVQDVDAYRRSIGAHFAILRDDDTSDTDLKAALGAVFSGLLSLVKSLDDYIGRLPQSSSLRASLEGLVSASLRPALHAALRYEYAATDAELTASPNLTGWIIFEQPAAPSAHILAEGLSPRWTDGAASWATFYASTIATAPDDSVFGPASWSERRRIQQAALHNLFTGVFDRFLAAYASAVAQDAAALEESLAGTGNQPPHYALFLAFLRLSRHAQDGLNEFSARHLDHYYRRVLRLARKPAHPDAAHLIIELAKGVEETLLPKDMLFRGGKDSAGNELLYGLDEETVVNRAKVVSLAALYAASSSDGADAGRLFYAPVIHSADGLGAEIKSEDKSWHPYALRGDGGTLAMPKASVGFAVASHHLLLAEGQRIILLKLPLSAGAWPTSVSFDCYLTTTKGWHHVPDATLVSANTSETPAAPCKAVRILLSGAVPGITAWDAAVHGGAFATPHPVLKVVLRHTAGTVYDYAALQGLRICAAEIEVRVGVDESDAVVPGAGIKNLLAAGDYGPFSPMKPAQPFGPEPAVGAAITVGSEEAFSKSGLRLALRAEWKGKPAAADIDFETNGSNDGEIAPSADARYLAGGAWKDFPGTPLNIFGDAAAASVFPTAPQPLPADGLLPPGERLTPFDANARAGFLRFALRAGFGHAEHRAALVLFQTRVSTTDPGPAPWTPQWTSLQLHYTARVFSALNATDTAAFAARGLQFFHLHPAGEAEAHTALSGAPVPLLPQLLDGTATPGAGELYIGIQHLTMGQSVRLLVGVAEGTTNPRIVKPMPHVAWSYLTGNAWKAFQPADLTDGTAGFVRTGTVEAVIPTDARTDNTLLPAGMLWMRASISSEPDAVARLLDIAAGAATVSLRGEGYAPDAQAAPRAAGSIAKPKTPIAAVKKVLQPYASFGGRSEESADAFAQRAAERLRHRDRAVALWDYEHLVLEAFPSLYRAKCLPHTLVAAGEYRENAPGHVTIVTIPRVAPGTEASALKPYTHESTLQAVREFLVPRMTAHAALHVVHPQFEDVELHAGLALRPGYEFNAYRKRLQEELVAFLSPWTAGAGADKVLFGSRVRKSALIDFIESRPYVDYLTDVKLYHTADAVRSADVDEAVASTARSILVSAPPAAHLFTEVTTEAV